MLKVIGLILLTMNFVHADADKVIYGDDNRAHVYQSSNELFKQLAKSTAAMIPVAAVETKFNGLIVQIKGESLKESMGICEDQKYADLVTSAICSGFLVGEDLLVTAGHCIPNTFACSNNKWVFDFSNDISINGSTSFVDPSSVYSCKKIIRQVFDRRTKNDFALIQLDRKVTNRGPLKYRSEGKIEDGQEVVVIGHPSGLPTIIADGAQVRTNKDDWYFSANLDTFAGNSGSAVFNAETGVIEGILVRGEKDYEFDKARICYNVKNCENDGCVGEGVTRITVIPELAPGMTPVEPISSDIADTAHLK